MSKGLLQYAIVLKLGPLTFLTNILYLFCHLDPDEQNKHTKPKNIY